VAKILLVEDDSLLSAPLVRWLQKQQHTVEVVESGEDALQMLGAYKFDIVILDWGLPEMSGIEVLKNYRRSGGLTPIIFLTGKGDVESKKQGLDSGADDYLHKPFEEEELGARIRSLLRRPTGLLPTTLAVRNVTVEPEHMRVFVGDCSVKLGKKEYGVLEFLMRHPNRCFSAQELRDAVWPSDADTTEDAVRSCMRQLRSKISGADGSCIIDTIPGAGYTIVTE
jgi:DNA-binding response OmpR family regulator